jgi:hypothetical protein
MAVFTYHQMLVLLAAQCRNRLWGATVCINH